MYTKIKGPDARTGHTLENALKYHPSGDVTLQTQIK